MLGEAQTDRAWLELKSRERVAASLSRQIYLSDAREDAREPKANRRRQTPSNVLRSVAQNSTNMRLFRFATKLFDRIVDSQNNVDPLDLRNTSPYQCLVSMAHHLQLKSQQR